VAKPDPSLGAMSEAVRRLHANLRERRFHIPRDEAARGYFGPGTRQAVLQFQRAAGLPLSGVADARTVSALGISIAIEVVAATPVPEPESPREQAVNATCPWSGKPVHPEALLLHEERLVGFCSPGHRDKFALAIAHFDEQRALPLERKTCPWSGKRVRPNATVVYGGQTVGFCSPAHRDQFHAALAHFTSPATAAAPTSDSADSMAPMEGVADTTYVPPLVDETALAQFCQAIQTYADGQGLHDAAAAALNRLQVRLAGLRDMASLARLTLIGHPRSFARLEDELRCLADAFTCEKLEPDAEYEECCEQSSDHIVLLSAAVDLFAGATFVWNHDPPRRDRTILAVVRAIEDAVAFPAAFAAEAAVFLGASDSALSPMYAALVIANATERLLACGPSCPPRPLPDIRGQLKSLALAWMEANPVTAFFEAIEGPKVRHIVRWEADAREGPRTVRIGASSPPIFRPAPIRCARKARASCWSRSTARRPG
jgi:peptidoglycan hydrolase-like protein with peptidoglycan-binding domain